MEQKATVSTTTIKAHYDKKKNVTKIQKKSKQKHGEEKESKEVLSGLRILKLVTEKGGVSVDY